MKRGTYIGGMDGIERMNGMKFDGIEFMKREGRKEKEIHTRKIRKEIVKREIEKGKGGDR